MCVIFEAKIPEKKHASVMCTIFLKLNPILKTKMIIADDAVAAINLKKYLKKADICWAPESEIVCGLTKAAKWPRLDQDDERSRDREMLRESGWQ